MLKPMSDDPLGVAVTDDLVLRHRTKAVLPSKYICHCVDALAKAKAAGGEHAFKIKLPNLQQRRWLALVAQQLDVIAQHNRGEIPWHSCTLEMYRLFSEGGIGKTWLVHTFIVPAVVYALQSVPKSRLVVDESSLCPAEAYNMELLRTPFACQVQWHLNNGAYSKSVNYWGRIQLVLELGDPLQNNLVRAGSLFGSTERLMKTAENNREASVEAETVMRAFNDADFLRRFVSVDPLRLFLESLRGGDASKGRFVLSALCTQFGQRFASQEKHGALMMDGSARFVLDALYSSLAVHTEKRTTV